jgi:hypothetical protein
MAKGQQTPADSTVRQTNLPEYADPYFRRMLQGAEEALMPFQPVIDPDTGEVALDQFGNERYEDTYQRYQGERIAPSEMYGDIMGSRAMVRGISETGIPGMPQAMGGTQTAMSGVLGASQFAPGRFSAVAPGTSRFGEYEYTDPTAFLDADIQGYMSPYMQNVVERQREAAILEDQRQLASRNAAAVSAGAFGGSRQGVQEALAQEALGRQLGDIQAIGSQQAYEQAVAQFNAQRAMEMDMDARRAGELGRVEAARAQQQQFADQLRQQEAARTQSALEQSRQFGAGQALAGFQALGGLSSQLAGLGQQQRAADIQGAQLLETIGRDVRAEDQARLDMAYEDFVRQRDFPISQYERMAGILRGIPVTPNVEEQRFASYNPVQQALGAGISGLGLYKGLAG